MGSRVVAHVLSGPATCGLLVPRQDRAHVPCIRRWILDHWTLLTFARTLAFSPRKIGMASSPARGSAPPGHHGRSQESGEKVLTATQA